MEDYENYGHNEVGTDPNDKADMLDVPVAAPPTPATIEEWGAQYAAKLGYDPTKPETQREIAQISNVVRKASPGKTDAELIETLKTQGPMIAQKLLPKMSQDPTFDMEDYQRKVKALQSDYGGDAEVAKRSELRNANLGPELGRTLGMGYRLAAGKEYQGALDDQYNSAKAGNEDRIMGDWQVQKKAKLAEIEQLIKNGEISRQQTRDMIDKMAFEQLRTETATKQAQNVSYNDPNTLSSEGARAMLEKGQPNLRKQMGEAKWSQITKAFVAANYPTIDKMVEAEIKKQEKEQERQNKTDIARGHDQTAIDVANIRANAKGGSGSGGQAKPGDQLKQAGIEQTETTAIEKSRGAAGSLQAIKSKLEELEPYLDRTETGPIAGWGPVAAVRGVIDPDVQRIKNIQQDLTSLKSKLLGSNPTDTDRRFIEKINDFLSMDDPKAAIASLKAEADAALQSHAENVATREAQINRTRGMVGAPPAPPRGIPTPPNKGGEMVPMVNAQGRTITIPFNRVKEAEADGFRRQ